MPSIWWTRFSPTPTARMHLGHAWCAWLNYCHGHEEGIILRYEDQTARSTSQLPESVIAESCVDFRTGLRRLSVPIAKEVYQSDRMEAYDIINRERFEGKLAWRLRAFAPMCHWPSGPYWAGSESPDMALLSRVVDDHDFGIRHVIRGEELSVDIGLYGYFWWTAYGHEPRYVQPVLWYIPDVCYSSPRCPMCVATEKGLHPNLPPRETIEKVSKSRITGNFILDDCDIDPLPFLWHLTKNMMLPSPFSGPIADARTLDVLRRWTALATLNPYPHALRENEHLSWKEVGDAL